MGGIKNPFGGGNIGTTQQLTLGILPGMDTSIKDPAGMQQYTDLANQAQQTYGQNQKFLQENVDPQRKSLLTALADQASGKAPSVAEAQLKSAFDTSLKNQLALARSQRGGNAGLAARNVSNIAAQQQQNLAQQGAIAKLQERNQAQQALGQQIQNEQNYGVNTLSAALGSQANVATMQNAQRDRNDKRNKDILGGVMDLGKSVFSGGLFAKGGQVQYLAEGGQVKSKKEFYKQLKACGGKVQKKAQGGAIDVGDVSAFAKGASDNNEIDNSIGGVSKKKKPTDDSSKGTAGMTDSSGKDMAGMADLAKVAFMAAEGGQVNDNQVQKVSEMDDEIAKKIFKEKGSIALQKYLQNKKRLPAAEPQQNAELQKKAEGGQILPENMTPEEKKMYLEHGAEAVENARKNKKMRDNMFNLPEQDYKAEGGQINEEPVQKVSEMDEEARKIFKEHGSIALKKYLDNKKMRQNMYNMPKQDYKAEGGLMLQAGGVPGTAKHAGDNYANDKVPAMLSPGEVVVPRSVIADGPKAAAIFVEKASKDKNYNAENYAQERPSFIKALGGMKKKESDYENFKKMIRGR